VSHSLPGLPHAGNPNSLDVPLHQFSLDSSQEGCYQPLMGALRVSSLGNRDDTSHCGLLMPVFAGCGGLLRHPIQQKKVFLAYLAMVV